MHYQLIRPYGQPESGPLLASPADMALVKSLVQKSHLGLHQAYFWQR